jgi:hypothetical protein
METELQELRAFRDEVSQFMATRRRPPRAQREE